MAFFRLQCSVVSRGAGQSSVAASAYRAGARLAETLDPAKALGAAAYISGSVLAQHDFSAKRNIVHTEIMAPDNAPPWMQDRERLWNAVEHSEKRKDAQLARELTLTLPRELDHAAQLETVRGFARELVDMGMVVDLALHSPRAKDGEAQPHAHLLCTMREVDPDARHGFGLKIREWNSREVLCSLREGWAEHVNAALERAGEAERVDHRRLEVQFQDALARGDFDAAATLDREPEPKIGHGAAKLERRGIATERMANWRAVRERNAERAAIYERVGKLHEVTRAAFLEVRARSADAVQAMATWTAEQAARMAQAVRNVVDRMVAERQERRTQAQEKRQDEHDVTLRRQRLDGAIAEAAQEMRGRSYMQNYETAAVGAAANLARQDRILDERTRRAVQAVAQRMREERGRDDGMGR